MSLSEAGVGVGTAGDEIFSMADFRKKQRERLRQEKWKYLEQKMKIEKKKYYSVWKKYYFASNTFSS